MKITMLGTGNAVVTECYNTCFVLTDEKANGEKSYFMVDAGGGGQILHQLKYAGFDWKDMKEIFLTHKHVDHFTGMIWMIRVITQNMKAGKYEGTVRIYGHEEVIRLLDEISHMLLQAGPLKFLGDRLQLIAVEDGETREINGRKVTFFDIHSTKAKQFGFSMALDNGEKLTCCGDEPYNETEKQYAENSKWLLHEAFCLYEDREEFHPYEKHHSTAKDAAELAAGLGVENLLLYHTEDKTIKTRKQRYTEEAQQYFRGNVFVPEDLETIEV